MSVNTSNDFWLGSDGEGIRPMVPIEIKTREQAYRTAAWIELMGFVLPHEEEEGTFEEIREAIRNT